MTPITCGSCGIGLFVCSGSLDDDATCNHCGHVVDIPHDIAPNLEFNERLVITSANILFTHEIQDF